jgi:predicted MFS family arabinose efflux permease
MSTDALVLPDDRAKRQVLLLAVSQALYSSAIVILMATGGLVGVMLAPSKGWATMPISTFVIGSMVATVPASFFMQRFGRRLGFIIGATIAAIGSLLAVYAIYHADFILFCIASFMFGVFQATSNYLRFAAADISSPSFRPKAISWTLTGGVLAAIFGTLIVIRTIDLLAPFTFAGSYAAAFVVCVAAIIVLIFLDIPHIKQSEERGEARPLAELLRQPRLVVAVACATLGYGMMNLVMTATPIAMVDCGFASTDASWVIQWHVLGMFVPSFVTGHIIAHYGVERVCALGMFILIVSAAINLAGITFGHFAVALILLGIGWNFAFIGGTTMLTGTYRPPERAKVQAFNDFCISATMAVGSLSSGSLLSWLGWSAVNIAVLPMALLALALIAWLYWMKPARARA